ncbi:MAG: hypothetical protein IH897_08955, partial [Planctomycetes bacterium]|nr:hypothetical protein [Planctomycetota bacterium]
MTAIERVGFPEFPAAIPMTHLKELSRKIEAREARVGVIGLGYVGSVAAAGLAKAGHDVLGIDVDAEKIRAYRAGSIAIYEPGLAELIHYGVGSGKLRFLHSQEVAEPLGEAILITTGTPTTESGAADSSQAKSALAWIREQRASGGAIFMKSTVPPGT